MVIGYWAYKVGEIFKISPTCCQVKQGQNISKIRLSQAIFIKILFLKKSVKTRVIRPIRVPITQNRLAKILKTAHFYKMLIFNVLRFWPTLRGFQNFRKTPFYLLWPIRFAKINISHIHNSLIISTVKALLFSFFRKPPFRPVFEIGLRKYFSP